MSSTKGKENGSIEQIVTLLSNGSGAECDYVPHPEQKLPSIEKLREFIELVRAVIFPGYFGPPITSRESLPHFIGVRVEKIAELLGSQIALVLQSEAGDAAPDGPPVQDAAAVAREFVNRLPEIRRVLCTDVKSIYDGDPAAKSHVEIIFCYPSIRAMINHRTAHTLLDLGVPLIPRIISEMSHSDTGIDIHPGAEIGEYFCIDHGTGVVIGETCIIGDHVRIYQGVTLGAKRFELDKAGNPVKNLPRHPIIEDGVVIYSNANILGRITIGRNSVIGGSVWVTRSVPPNSRLQQQKAVESSFINGLGI
ncbi:MAG: serine acetyltransferase [Chlorobiaceae bacterium]|nr:serine acetyltransferase [Chlorobiaceae bacterium]NTW75077.1 serine acetyltransferase [Chlorobiaceae bacterium]